MTSQFDINQAFADLLHAVQLEPEHTGGTITFTGEDPILPSNHRLGAIMAMGMMGAAAATQILYRLRGGAEQDLCVDLRGAVAHINPMAFFKPTSNGYPYQTLFAAPSYNPMAFGIYSTKDGRSYLPTAAYPKMIPDWVSLLRCDLNEKSVREAISKWNAQDLEDAAAARGMIGSICRTPEEWLAHPQGRLLASQPLIEIIKIGDSAPEMPKLTNPERPLSGFKIASFTHVIAGMVVGRTLAEQGAQVLHLARPEFDYDALYEDTSVGTRSTWMDLEREDHLAQAKRLLAEADVVVENFRNRSLAKRGLSAAEVAKLRPGIVYASVRAFGWEGPWSQRGGFDMDANCCSGFAVREGSKEHPKLPPTIVLNDYLAGYLTAMGVIAALILRAKHGGSYHVRASLARFSMWYSELGVFDPAYVSETIRKPEHRVIPPRGIHLDSPYGPVRRLEPGIAYSRTPAFWDVPGHPVLGVRGASEAAWLDY
jgi:crotonobetainyl-CoA:carnitine CoA-transferase CaiB-like acyl-CoA transferase